MNDNSKRVGVEERQLEREILASGFEELKSATLQQISDSGKWVSAALLTINGGGALAAVGAAAKSETGHSAIAFGLGIVFAIASVALIGKASYDAVGVLMRARLDALAGRPISNDYNGVINPFVIADILDFLSLAMFVYGAAMLSTSIRDTSNDARCLVIQSDMLSANPRRSDDAVLFTALGCRPQGGGSVFAPPTKLERAAGHPLPNGGRR